MGRETNRARASEGHVRFSLSARRRDDPGFWQRLDRAPLNPLAGIAAAVTRRTLDGKHPGGWVPEQKITVEEAVRAYTLGSAYAEYAEEAKGTVTVGKLADLIVLDKNIFHTPDIESARVEWTILGGRVVYQAEKKL